MTETKKFDDQKLLVSTVVLAGGEKCALLMSVEGIEASEMPPLARTVGFEEIQETIEALREEMRRAFAVYVVARQAKKKTKRKSSAKRKTAARSSAPLADAVEESEAAADQDADAAAGEVEQDDKNKTEETPPVKNTKTAGAGQGSFFDRF